MSVHERHGEHLTGAGLSVGRPFSHPSNTVEWQKAGREYTQHTGCMTIQPNVLHTCNQRLDSFQHGHNVTGNHHDGIIDAPHPSVLQGCYDVGDQRGPMAIFNSHLRLRQPRGPSHSETQAAATLCMEYGHHAKETVDLWLRTECLAFPWKIFSLQPAISGPDEPPDMWTTRATTVFTDGMATHRMDSPPPGLVAPARYMGNGQGMSWDRMTRRQTAPVPHTPHERLLMKALGAQRHDHTNGMMNYGIKLEPGPLFMNFAGMYGVDGMDNGHLSESVANVRRDGAHWQHPCWDIFETGHMVERAGLGYDMTVAGNLHNIAVHPATSIGHIIGVDVEPTFVNDALAIVAEVPHAVTAYGPYLGKCQGQSVDGNRCLYTFERGSICVVNRSGRSYAHLKLGRFGQTRPTVVDNHHDHHANAAVMYTEAVLVSTAVYINTLGAIAYIIGSGVPGHTGAQALWAESVAEGLRYHAQLGKAYGMLHSHEAWRYVDHGGVLASLRMWRRSHMTHRHLVHFDALTHQLSCMIVYGRPCEGWTIAAGVMQPATPFFEGAERHTCCRQTLIDKLKRQNNGAARFEVCCKAKADEARSYTQCSASRYVVSTEWVGRTIDECQHTEVTYVRGNIRSWKLLYNKCSDSALYGWIASSLACGRPNQCVMYSAGDTPKHCIDKAANPSMESWRVQSAPPGLTAQERELRISNDAEELDAPVYDPNSPMQIYPVFIRKAPWYRGRKQRSMRFKTKSEGLYEANVHTPTDVFKGRSIWVWTQVFNNYLQDRPTLLFGISPCIIDVRCTCIPKVEPEPVHIPIRRRYSDDEPKQAKHQCDYVHT